MTKMKLGNDFTEDSEEAQNKGEESDQKTTDDESEDETDNSGDSDNSKKPVDDEADESEDNDGDDADEDDKSEDDADSEDDKKSDEDDKSDDDSDKSDKEPDKAKVLQGLLDTEKDLDADVGDVDSKIAAAKQRISQKRKDRREKRDLVETIDEKFPDTDKEEETDDLSDIDPETLKVLDRFTKAKGLVPKSELQRMSYQEQHKSAQDAFYASHPEYLPENDPDDTLYKAIKNELAQFAAPKDPKQIPALFAKAHRLVMDQFPDKFKTSKKTDTDKKEVSDADKSKSVRLKTSGLGGKPSGSGDGGNKSNNATKKTFSPTQIRALEDGGWSPEEIKNLTG
jgi:hypothetical protein